MRLGRHPDLLPFREAGLSGVSFKALVAPEEGARHGGRDHQNIEQGTPDYGGGQHGTRRDTPAQQRC